MSSKPDNSYLSYTSRDYESILKELLNTIPLLSKDWTSREESDPGIVLVKLMAMVGDMLSYNLDKQVLELFPESVTQRKNAYQIYNLLGYKMHWYKSARCNAKILINSSDYGSNIPRYSRFSTLDGSIYYTNIKEISADPGVSTASAELIQGIPKTPALISSGYKLDPWYANYDFNLSTDDFVNNKYYLNDVNIDEDTIVLCDSEGEWILVEDVDLINDTNKSLYGNKYFDFRVDEYDRPYIRLCSSWNDKNEGSIKLKLFYILSRGSDGSISSGTLKSNDKMIATVINSASSEGYDPETPFEAWINSRNWVNTNNTLITCDDFTKAVKRIEGVSNAIALDWMTDIENPITSGMKNYEVRIYVIPDNDYVNSKIIEDSSSYEVVTEQLMNKIDNYIKSNKILNLLTFTYFDRSYMETKEDGSIHVKTTDKITHYKWQIEGIIYYRTPLDKSDSDNIISLINNSLKLQFGISKLDFNQAIRYIDVVNSILSADSRILYVDLNPIVYKVNDNGELKEATEEELTGKYVIEIKPNLYFDSSSNPSVKDLENYDESLDIAVNPDYNPCLYEINLENIPIKPSTVSIKVETGNYTIYDDGNGRLVSGIVEGENNIIANSNGTIDYGRYGVSEYDSLDNIPEYQLFDNNVVKIGSIYYIYTYKDGESKWVETDKNPCGLLRFELRYATSSPIIISYKKNKLAIAEYENLNPEKFYASSDSLRRKV